MLRRGFSWVCSGSLLLGAAVACSAGGSGNGSGVHGSGGSGNSGNATGNGGSPLVVGSNGGASISTDGGPTDMDNPESCADAANAKTYVGCDFWPTVVYNPVYNVFDFAAVVANAGTQPADVTVSRSTGSVKVTVQPGSLQEIKLPWVPELKGPAFDATTQGSRPTTSVRSDGGAYHLVSTFPVTVWQFNPLEYKKDAAELMSEMKTCDYPPSLSNGDGTDCESVSADAALLIPSTALTGNYRVTTKSSTPVRSDGTGATDAPGGFAITATQDMTHVKVQLAGDLAAGTGITEGASGSVVEYDLNQGDVLELLGKIEAADMPAADLSGSIVAATKPVQVIGFNPLTNVPSPAVAGSGVCCADHLEETVLPAEVLGKHYVIASPSTHTGGNAGHFLRFVGDFDNTTLQYKPANPPGAPGMLMAGQVVEIDVTAGFEVLADQPFALVSTMKSGTVQNNCTMNQTATDCFVGDPSMTDEVAVEQFRQEYIFLAPSDFAFNWADVLMPTGANVTLDGAPLGGTAEVVDDGWSVKRVPLMTGTTMGAHKLSSDMPVGLQVMGYGHATSYYYPGGLNLKLIAQVPPVK
jgi:hypothetical protein